MGLLDDMLKNHLCENDVEKKLKRKKSKKSNKRFLIENDELSELKQKANESQEKHNYTSRNDIVPTSKKKKRKHQHFYSPERKIFKEEFGNFERFNDCDQEVDVIIEKKKKKRQKDLRHSDTVEKNDVTECIHKKKKHKERFENIENVGCVQEVDEISVKKRKKHGKKLETVESDNATECNYKKKKPKTVQESLENPEREIDDPNCSKTKKKNRKNKAMLHNSDGDASKYEIGHSPKKKKCKEELVILETNNDASAVKDDSRHKPEKKKRKKEHINSVGSNGDEYHLMKRKIKQETDLKTPEVLENEEENNICLEKENRKRKKDCVKSKTVELNEEDENFCPTTKKKNQESDLVVPAILENEEENDIHVEKNKKRKADLNTTEVMETNKESCIHLEKKKKKCKEKHGNSQTVNDTNEEEEFISPKEEKQQEPYFNTFEKVKDEEGSNIRLKKKKKKNKENLGISQTVNDTNEEEEFLSPKKEKRHEPYFKTLEKVKDEEESNIRLEKKKKKRKENLGIPQTVEWNQEEFHSTKKKKRQKRGLKASEILNILENEEDNNIHLEKKKKKHNNDKIENLEAVDTTIQTNESSFPMGLTNLENDCDSESDDDNEALREQIEKLNIELQQECLRVPVLHEHFLKKGNSKGAWLKEETEILKANWENMLEEFIEYDMKKILFHKRDGSKITKRYITQYLGRGLEDRCLKAIYNKTRELYGMSKTGRLTIAEERQIEGMIAKYGPRWQFIGDKLHRRGHTIKNLIRRKHTRSKARGKWSKDEIERLIKALENRFGEDGFNKNNIDIWKNIPWIEIAREVGTRTTIQCRKQWYYNTYKILLTEEEAAQKWTREHTAQMIESLAALNLKDHIQVDWYEFSKNFPENFVRMRNRFITLRMQIPNFEKMSFKEVLDTLANEYCNTSLK